MCLSVVCVERINKTLPFKHSWLFILNVRYVFDTKGSKTLRVEPSSFQRFQFKNWRSNGASDAFNLFELTCWSCVKPPVSFGCKCLEICYELLNIFKSKKKEFELGIFERFPKFQTRQQCPSFSHLHPAFQKLQTQLKLTAQKFVFFFF